MWEMKNMNEEIKTLREENEKLRRLLDEASQTLYNNGFKEESKRIDCEAEFWDVWGNEVESNINIKEERE